MDLDKTIRPWIVACGKQYGINHAYHFHCTDESTRQNFKYCTYHIVSIDTTNNSAINLSSKSGYTSISKWSQEWDITVQVDLYNSKYGMVELASLCVGAEMHQSIKNLFDNQLCAFVGSQNIEDITTYDDERVRYHQMATVLFTSRLEHSLSFDNEVVDEILTNTIIHGVDD